MSNPQNIKLYHVTREANVNSILAVGISPAFALGKLRASWYVDASRLSWAIAHVSENTGLSVAELYVCHVLAERSYFQRTRFTGVFTSKALLFAWQVDKAILALRPDDLDK
jgi:hypothetical protein